jgi:hypothetical protein
MKAHHQQILIGLALLAVAIIVGIYYVNKENNG